MKVTDAKPVAEDDLYLLRSIAHMRGEISAAQEIVQALAGQLETWRVWHEELEHILTAKSLAPDRLDIGNRVCSDQVSSTGEINDCSR